MLSDLRTKDRKKTGTGVNVQNYELDGVIRIRIEWNGMEEKVSKSGASPNIIIFSTCRNIHRQCGVNGYTE